MSVICKGCKNEYSIDVCSNDGQLYVTALCPNCDTKCNHCLVCNKNYFCSSFYQDYRHIRKHVETHHPNSQSSTTNSAVTSPVHDASQSTADEFSLSDSVLDDANSTVSAAFCEPSLNEVECMVDQLDIEEEQDVNCDGETLHHFPVFILILVHVVEFFVHLVYYPIRYAATSKVRLCNALVPLSVNYVMSRKTQDRY